MGLRKKVIKKLLVALFLASSSVLPSHAVELETDHLFTPHAMGCMMMRECTKNVEEVKNIKDVESYQGRGIDHSLIAVEFNSLVKVLNNVGVNVYIAPIDYFLIGIRGVYYTEGNNIFLNSEMVERSSSLITVMRHEGWHTAQDCMAGDIKNRFIAIILDNEKIPKYFKNITESTYSMAGKDSSIPWEQEAYWAGHTVGMTQNALESCSTGAMWNEYPPTPLTKEFLIEKGYIKE